MAGPDTGRRPDAWTAETIFADDLGPGDVFELGGHTLSEAELTRFAGEWDPQFFHVDAAAAERGMFGGLIASGIHTMAVFQRLSVEGFWGRAATIAARGHPRRPFRGAGASWGRAHRPDRRRGGPPPGRATSPTPRC